MSRALTRGGFAGGSYLTANPIADKDIASEYIRKELKTDLHEKQTEALIEALTEPKVYLAKRKTFINGADNNPKVTGGMNARLGDYFYKRVKVYEDAGYPNQEALDMARNDTAGEYEIEMRTLNAIIPGGDYLLSRAMVKNSRAVNDGKVLLGATSEQEWKKAYKQKRKQKKAARAKSTA